MRTIELRFRVALLLALALASMGAAQPIVGVSVDSVTIDPVALDYVVKSKIYPEDPDTMYLTLRGGGVTVYDVSTPQTPTIRTRWATSEDVEGQDRRGDLLVVVGRAGKLFSFDVSDPNVITLLGQLTLSPDPSLVESISAALALLVGNGPFDALHVKLDLGIDGRLYAFVTATASGEILAVDVEDPAAMVQVGDIDTGIQFIEGIFIKDHHAFVGGFGSSETYKAVDLTDPTNMSIAKTLTDPAYRQMVSELRPEFKPNVLFAALWNTDGGLGAFDVTDPANFTELDKIARPELTQSNRVKFEGNYAWIPLEQDPGGLAVFDVTDPSNLGFLGLATDIKDVALPYTLEINAPYVFLFGTTTQSMAVMKFEREFPPTRWGMWNFGPGTVLGDLAGSGIPADDGLGILYYLDPADTGATGTATHTSVGTAAGIGYLGLDPDGDSWGDENGLFMRHELPYDFYGTFTQYTLVWDVYIPDTEFDVNGCFSGALTSCNDIPLYQLDRTNSNDPELFLKVGKTSPLGDDNGFVGKTGDPLSGGLGGYSEALEPDTWHRIAMVVDLRLGTGHVEIYVDGANVHFADQVDYELFAPLSQGDTTDPNLIAPERDGFLLFADNSGEMDAQVYLSSFLFVDMAYSAAEIAALGAPTASGIPVPVPEASRALLLAAGFAWLTLAGRRSHRFRPIAAR